MKINEYEIDVKVTNNKMKYTLLSVHGINSSMGFTKNLDEMKNNFNHIKISLPITGKIKVSDLNEIISVILEKHIKSKNIVLLGHSLGGVQTAFNAQHHKVKKVVFVSPFNPTLYSASKRIMVNSLLSMDKLSSLIEKQISKYLPVSADILSAVLDKDRPYREIFKDALFNPDFIKELDNQYRTNEKDTLYMIGSKDKIINPKNFQKYVTNLGGELNIVDAWHNPFKDSINESHKLLNDFIPQKKKWIKRKLIKNIE